MIVQWCHVIIQWCHVIVQWCHVIMQWCHVIVQWCHVIMQWCHVIMQWCHVIMQWFLIPIQCVCTCTRSTILLCDPPPSLPGPDLPSPQVQHTVSNQDRSGASEPLRTAQDAGRSEESQQVIPPPRYQGM